MRRSYRQLGLAAIAAAFATSPVAAQVLTTQFNVNITITAACLLKSATTLNFGTAGVIAANIDSTSAIVVQCTNNTPYNLGLNEGTGTGATIANRLMTGPAAATVGYSLYTTTGRTTVWGNTIASNTQTGTGTGSDQTFTVFGRVPPQASPAVGNYTDTITATLTY